MPRESSDMLGKQQQRFFRLAELPSRLPSLHRCYHTCSGIPLQSNPRDGHLSHEEDLPVLGEGDGRGGSSQDMQSFPLWGIRAAKYAAAGERMKL